MVKVPRPLGGGRLGGRPPEGGGLGCLCRASNRPTIYGMARGCHRAADDHGETVGKVIGGELGAGRLDLRRGHAGIVGHDRRAGDGGSTLTRRG